MALPPALKGARVRILAVGNMYPPHHQGGYELVWQAAMRQAREDGHAVRVITSDHREPGIRREEDPDVHRTLRWYWSYEHYEFPRLSLQQRVRLERTNAAEIRRHLREFRPEVVTWWGMGCMSLSLIEQVRRAGVRSVFSVHDDWLLYGPNADQWTRIWRGRRRLLAPIAAAVSGIPTRIDVNRAGPALFNSCFIRRRAAEAGVNPPGSTVIHPGVDARFLDPLPDRTWQWRLLSVGRIDRHKGVDTAVSALAHLPEAATLTVCGTGDPGYLAEMRDQAERIGVADRVSFKGFAGPGDLRTAFAEADVIVFPVRWEEPWGLVPLEAMGLGRPVVSTARGGSVEYLQDGQNALLIEPDDPRALAERIQRLGRDPRLRARLRGAGRRTAAEHTAAEFARLTVDAIVAAAGHPA